MSYTSQDYLVKINEMKSGYLDSLWNDVQGWYEADDGWGLYPQTWLNAYMIQIIAILAGKGLVTESDKIRHDAVINKLIVSPAYNGNTWSHHMNELNYDIHPALDQPVAEALYYSWKYRHELNLSVFVVDAIIDILTVNKASSFTTYDAGTIALGNTDDNQATSKWKFNRIAYAVMMGATQYNSDLSNCLKRFVYYINNNHPGSINNNLSNLFPDYGWRYIEAMNWQSFEYGAMCLGGVLEFYPEISTIVNLTLDEKAKIKAWERHILGMWQKCGYPNWDTIWSNQRLHTLSYFAWSIRSLTGIAKNTELNMGTKDYLYAKYMLDQMVDSLTRMDTWNNDPVDGNLHKYPMTCIGDVQTYGIDYNHTKSSSNAKIAMELAMCIENGIADQPSEEPSNIWGWGWAGKHVHISTSKYSASSLPYAPAINYWGADAVQLQHWGISRIQLPTNEILTAMGGYGLEAFSFIVKKDGITEMDTSKDVPVQEVYLDGVKQIRQDYDTVEYPLTFQNNIRNYCYKQGTNYKVEVETIFYNDKIKTTHRATLTGTPGTGQAVMSIPARKNVVIDYIDVNDNKTVVWDGSIINQAGSPHPDNCKYIHMKWAQWNAGILLIPKTGVVASGAKVTVLDYYPNGYPERQPDQDRSLLIYLADSATNMGDVSLKYEVYITNGTDQGAENIYNSTLYEIAGNAITIHDLEDIRYSYIRKKEVDGTLRTFKLSPVDQTKHKVRWKRPDGTVFGVE